MKILAIRGENLASLEAPFAIDYTLEPLRSAGLYAITGPTGSGKSTLLDAICLALFNATPRIAKSETRESILDVGNRTISLSDSRQILRRGAASGYAEVDFIALTGEHYRSRWSVNRARNKAQGTMQGWSIELTNLTTKRPMQGGKKEILAKIVSLIGLTFDQFTRSVLLAQGDFATFLRAAKNEKADLLEKLTGTEIYSRISQRIYQRTQDAKAERNAIEEKIKDIPTLTPDNLLQLTTELQEGRETIKRIEELRELLKRKQEWIATEALHLKDIETARETIALTTRSLDETAPRRDTLAQIDSVQAIRDAYKQNESLRQQLEKERKELATKKETLEKDIPKLDKKKQTIKQLTATKEEAEARWKSVEPDAKQARELEAKITAALTAHDEAQKEMIRVNEAHKGQVKRLDKTKEEIKATSNEIALITQWFLTHEKYAPIVAQNSLTQQDLQNAAHARKEIESNNKLKSNIEEAVKEQQKDLANAEKHLETLNRTLTSEIMILRKRLKHLTPCPVCGSIHHPQKQTQPESIEEQELNKQKKLAQQTIDEIKREIERLNGSIISHQTFAESYATRREEIRAKLAKSLSSILEWDSMYQQQTLAQYLNDITKEWTDKETQQRNLSVELEKLKERKAAIKEALHNASAEKVNKLKQATLKEAELRNHKKERNKLFEGRPIDEVEEEYKAPHDAAVRELNTATKKINTIAERVNKQQGEMAQLTQSVEANTAKTEELQQQIEQWLAQRTDGLTDEQLRQRLGYDVEWIATERQAIDAIQTAHNNAQTTLAERQRTHATHQEASHKPTDEETPEWLTNTLIENESLLTTTRDRNTQITTSLTNHENNSKSIAQYEEELTKRRANAEEWERLDTLFGSANGSRFKTIAQGYTLDVLLGYANRHLAQISSRYALERTATDALSLQVIDLDMLNERRAVNTLSGGESFLVSLALALGLSSLSSNKMSVESLFIDEGFGSLDADTLRTAMEALERLQSQGRKIGIISHVAEMTERITTQIQVQKNSNGKSIITIQS